MPFPGKESKKDNRADEQIRAADKKYEEEQLAGLHQKDKDPMRTQIRPRNNPMNQRFNKNNPMSTIILPENGNNLSHTEKRNKEKQKSANAQGKQQIS
jgi:hypothetical protein